jgi:antitoxin VapB
MAFHVRNSETERLTRALARQAKVGLTEAVHMAVKNEMARRSRGKTFQERTAAIVEEVSKSVKDPRPLGKEFYDSLYD